jgi:hypothetical protein
VRPINLILLLAAAGWAVADAQIQAPPQTARQALIEMLLAKSPGTFEKHLPEPARKFLLQGDDTSSTPILRELTSFRNGIVNSSGQLETFDSGSILLTIDEKEAQRKMKVIVERDDLAGVDDEIELSVHSYVNGKPQPLPVRPRIVLSMEQEKEVWKLNEVTVAMHVPLSDPDFLKDLQKTQNPGSESSATASLRTIMTAEIAYSSAFPERGFTCNLSELRGSELQDKPTHEHAMLIDDALASGKRGGYIFSISGCDVAPASKFSVTAAPKEPDSELRAFCSDESAVLRYAADGKAATCLSEGVPLE